MSNFTAAGIRGIVMQAAEVIMQASAYQLIHEFSQVSKNTHKNVRQLGV